MRAIRIDKPQETKLIKIPLPKLGTDDILIKIHKLGLCGSDLKTYQGSNPMVSYPIIPGHEICGEIVELGQNVPEKFVKGIPVTVSPYSSCGICYACSIGRQNCCQNNETLGVKKDGAATEFIAINFRKVFPCYELSDEQIVLVEPLSVGSHAVNRTKIKKNDTVLVFGCGVIGLGVIIAAVHKGANVIAVDIDDKKLEIAKKLGAGWGVNARKKELKQQVSEITNGNYPNVVIEAVGSKDTFVKAIDLVCNAGRIGYIGYAHEPVCFESKMIVSKELEIMGSRNALDHEINNVIQMIKSIDIDITCLITHRYSLGNISDALKMWNENPGAVTKIVVSL